VEPEWILLAASLPLTGVTLCHGMSEVLLTVLADPVARTDGDVARTASEYRWRVSEREHLDREGKHRVLREKIPIREVEVPSPDFDRTAKEVTQIRTSEIGKQTNLVLSVIGCETLLDAFQAIGWPKKKCAAKMGYRRGRNLIQDFAYDRCHKFSSATVWRT
jgi:hypothetical protein